MTEQVAPATPASNDWRRTSPVAIVFFFLSVLRAAINAGWYALVGVWGAIQAGKAAFILPALAILGLVLTIYAALSWLRFRYRLTSNKILLRKGILQRDQVTVEFDKVQNVRVLEPVYARPFGLALLEIDTAGSAQREITLGGIELPLARELRDRIVGHQGQKTALSDELEDTAESLSKPGETIIARDNKDIAIYGLTHNGLVWVAAVIGGVFSQVDDNAWLNPQRLFTWMNVDAWPLWQLASLIVLALCLLPLLSIFGGLWRYQGYELDRRGDVYRRQSGLLSRHDETIKRHKIQAATWNQNFVARWFGRINLKLKQAKAGSAEAEIQGNQKSSFLVPVLRPPEAIALTNELLPGLQLTAPSFSRVHCTQYIKKYLLFGWSIPLTVLHLVLALTVGPWSIALAPLTIGLAATLLYLLWRRIGYAVHGEYGLLRTGFIGSKTTIFPLFKVQRVDLRQSPSQRKRGLAHLTLHLASHSMTVPYISLSDAQTIRDLTLFHIETDQRPWF